MKTAREIAARVWCDQEMRNTVMDVDAAEEIATIIERVRRGGGPSLTPEQAQAAYDAAPAVSLSDERIQEIVAYATGKGPMPARLKAKCDADRITVAWLHDIRPPGWKPETRGISYANWTIHSIQSRPVLERDDWDGYDVGPFVWTVAPTHGVNMMPLEKPGRSSFTILVLENKRDVLLLLELLVGPAPAPMPITLHEDGTIERMDEPQ